MPGRPTVEELQARWGPFAANAGTYELSGDTLTFHAFVSKEPRDQTPGGFARLRVDAGGEQAVADADRELQRPDRGRRHVTLCASGVSRHSR